MFDDLNFPPWDQGVSSNSLQVNHHIPYTPFSKTDRIGKIADWVAPAGDDSLEKKADEYRGRKKLGPLEAFGTGFTSAFSYQISATEEADFSIVDRGPPPKTKSKGVKGPLPASSWGSKPSQAASSWGSKGASKRDYSSSQSKKNSTFGRGGQPDKNVRRDTSIKVEPEWVQVEELDFLRLSSLYFEVDDAVDV
jgi:translation initiation factor 3 subunit D